MDFIVVLPLMARKFDSIWMIVDRLSKSANFMFVNTKYRVEKYVEVYIARVHSARAMLARSSEDDNL
jgi:hypothetical protein